MKRVLNVIVLTLALNFLVLAAGVGWLYQAGRLSRDKVSAIKAIVFPEPAEAQPDKAASQAPTTRPLLKLEELVAERAGRPAAEQLEHIREAFDARMTQLERAHRELTNLQGQVQLAQMQIDIDRKKLDADRAALETQMREAQRLAVDQGFQDSLSLYTTLPAKQVKTIFLGLSDDIVVQYLQAMESRIAAKITREFKTPQEQQRLLKIMELMRQPQATAKE